MKPVVKNTLAVVAGLVVGSVVNMRVILVGGQRSHDTGASLVQCAGFDSCLYPDGLVWWKAGH